MLQVISLLLENKPGALMRVTGLLTQRGYNIESLTVARTLDPELSRSIHMLAEALPIHLDFIAVDFSLENRRARRGTIYDEAVAAIEATVVALKHPTITAEERPNATVIWKANQSSGSTPAG